ncbi:magnesium chelatase subunit D [Gordonia malaquae]|uniref:Putative magnesium chelatase subunit n=1 Tax=Gordonia malaquae NBRC 108250 TaxID=1223542 RepID=M3UW73_GORML|nr:VWA domain-containing protein [Gordonia malaquae]GAC79867.1 putative magnesium chelatase subunit [Gordonia malaquae NBRC 108250]SEC48968.1 magnesium chelatase subunit D [Gordonia malaquae]
MSDAVRYPFSAVVGQERLKLALILSAVSPGIGGVLIRGEKGTAKSTVVRGLGPLLGSQSRVVELPIGATEDRVVGSLDLTRVLRDGQAHFTPGLLAKADDGVLYIDEVNLLSDHLVDVLLDAAASGRVTVERDGVSHTQSARFVLVGTMNPEEGELRPQLLDRFGLVVDVAGPRDVDERVAIVTARMAFDADPAGFSGRHDAAESELAARISHARTALPDVVLPVSELRRIAGICAHLDVDGLRGDIVMARTATAHAAWRGASEVTEDDVRVAAELALPHRRRRNPFDESSMSEEQLDDALGAGDDAASRDPDGAPPGSPDGTPPDSPDDSPSNSSSDSSGSSSAVETSEDPDDDPPPSGGGSRGPQFGTRPTGGSPRVRTFRADGVGDGDPGRRSRARSTRGSTVRDVDFGSGTGVHLFGTVLAAARRASGDGMPSLQPGDLRGAERIGTESNLVVFLVDLSGSMTARSRLTAVRDACVEMLRDSYTRRDRVAVVVAAGADAYVAVPPTRSVDIAVGRLAQVRTGGRTPLAEGLQRSVEVIDRSARVDPHRRPLLVLLTDGRATGGRDAGRRADEAADDVARRGISSVVVDCEQGFVRLGSAVALAQRLRAEYVPLDDLADTGLAAGIRGVA